MSFVAALALEDAYDTFAHAQIAVQKAENAEGFVSSRSEAESEVWSGKLSGLVAAMEKYIRRKATVFVAQVLIDFVDHGASLYGRAENNAAEKLR